MSFLDKLKATLTSFQQRPDPSTAASDDRAQAQKDMNQQSQEEVADRARMQQSAAQEPDPSQGVEEHEVPLS